MNPQTPNPPRAGATRRAHALGAALLALSAAPSLASADMPPIPLLYELLVVLEGRGGCSLDSLECTNELEQALRAEYCNIVLYAWTYAPEYWRECL